MLAGARSLAAVAAALVAFAAAPAHADQQDLELSAIESPRPDALASWGAETLEQIERDLRRPGSSLYAEQGTSGGRRAGSLSPPAFAWPSSWLLRALAAAARVEPQRYRPRLLDFAHALDAYWAVKDGAGGYAVLPAGTERYHDDNACMTLALIDTYEATGERECLTRATRAFAFVARGEAKTRGGGIRQHEEREGPAAACATAPAVLGALRLHRLTGDAAYLRQAVRWYRFLTSGTSGLRNAADGLFHERGQGERAYLSAWVLQASLLLYGQSGDSTYLAEAQRLARASMARWVLPNGALKETGAWGGADLCGALLALYRVDGDPRWYAAVLRALRFLHERVRDPNGRYGEYWQEARAGQPLSTFRLLDMAPVAQAYWVAAAEKGPVLADMLPTSRKAGQVWRFATKKPGAGWEAPEFDDASWRSGIGGFGTPETPGAVVRTPWATSEIWLRRAFVLPEGVRHHAPHLVIHHDEDAEIYLNGRLLARLSGYTTGYVLRALTADQAKLLVPGRNVLALHVRQTGGGQYIDAGIVDSVISNQ